MENQTIKEDGGVMITIIDSIMGSGKTSWAINKMNQDTENNYIYITPYLKEVERIKEKCYERKFFEPLAYGGEGKLEDLHTLIQSGVNITSTHALFQLSTEATRTLIESNNYVLILDEVMDVIEQIHVTKDDINILLKMELITVDESTHRVKWNKDKDNFNGKYNDVKEYCETDSVFLVNNTMMMWTFPIEMFEAFNEVYVLTYMFNGQIQKYYYDLHNMWYEYKSVRMIDGSPVMIDYVKHDELSDIRSKIHILEDEKLNRIGESQYSLSKRWYEKCHKNPDTKPLVKQIGKNIVNYRRHKVANASNSDLMWATFKDYHNHAKAGGLTENFVSLGTRATNEFSDKWVLAYAVNVFLNPVIGTFFSKCDVKVNENIYALSEMIQWIWRSRIRNGEEIYLYIPSLRMRTLLKDWLNSSNTDLEKSTFDPLQSHA